MWEICKNAKDAASEFDRTMEFVENAINAYIAKDEKTSAWQVNHFFVDIIDIYIFFAFYYPFYDHLGCRRHSSKGSSCSCWNNDVLGTFQLSFQ